MKSSFLLIIIICSFFSCNQNKPSDMNDRIIYTLSKDATDEISQTYNKEIQVSPKDVFYLTVEVNKIDCKKDNYVFSLQHCDKDTYCSSDQKFISKTNRFLKLNNGKLIPITMISDMYFVKDDSYELPQKAGGDKNFIINFRGKLIESFSGM